MKNIIVTGANGNLGQAVARKLLDSGHRVLAIVRNESSRSLLPAHANLEVHLADLSDEHAADALVDKITSTHNRIDAACMIAGGFAMGDLEATSGDLLKKQFSLNFETAYYLSRKLFPHMMHTKYGRLIFIGARPALLASAGKQMIAYGLSKSLLFKLAEYMNAEGKGNQVTATVIVPSTIDTPDNRAAMPEANPSDWVKPEAIAELIELIVSEKGDPLREVVLKVYNNS